MSTIKNKTKKKSVPVNTNNQEILKLFKTHVETRNAIVDDYMIGNDSMEVELERADENFINSVEALEVEESVDQAMRILNDATTNGLDCDKLMDLLIQNFGEIELWDYMRNKGVTLVKINNLADQMKLDEFLTTEIYPLLADQIKYL